MNRAGVRERCRLIVQSFAGRTDSQISERVSVKVSAGKRKSKLITLLCHILDVGAVLIPDLVVREREIIRRGVEIDDVNRAGVHDCANVLARYPDSEVATPETKRSEGGSKPIVLLNDVQDRTGAFYLRAVLIPELAASSVEASRRGACAVDDIDRTRVTNVGGHRSSTDEGGYQNVFARNPDGQVRCCGYHSELASGQTSAKAIPGFRVVRNTGAVLSPELMPLGKIVSIKANGSAVKNTDCASLKIETWNPDSEISKPVTIKVAPRQ
jgi:hypothetical protein